MKYLTRNNSVITHKKTLEPLCTFKNFPVFIGATDKNPKTDLFADLSVTICKDTGIIQLDKVLPLEIVYSGYHSEALGGIWKQHHEKFIKFIKKYKIKKFLEIGGSDGRLAKNYIGKEKNISWTIVEPNPKEVNNENIKYIIKPFDKKFKFTQNIEAIIHSHTLEHMYEPDKFLKKISTLLHEGEYHIFSVPNLYKYLQNNYTNILNFEHTILLTEYFIDYLLKKNNFKIIKKNYFLDHSIFYATQKNVLQQKPEFSSKYKNYKRQYLNYLSFHKNVLDELNHKIDSFNGDIYLFGAHVFSQFLINQGLNQKRVVGILDNSKIKESKRLYGTSLSIYHPEILRMKKNSAVILKTGAYQEEIKTQLKKINSNIIIWE